MVDRRPVLDSNLLERLSVGSAEEVGLLLDMTALLEELPFLELRPLSESPCTSLDEGISSEVLCLECSPCLAVAEVFLLENASTAPVNLSRISCPTDALPGLSADGPAYCPAFPLEFRPLELALI